MQRVFEPAFEESDSVIEHSISAEVIFDVAPAHRQFPPQVVPVARIEGISAAWRWKPLEGVGHPDGPVFDSKLREHRSHEDARTPAPNARLEEIAWNLFLDDVKDALLQIVQSRHPDHGFGIRWPVAADCAKGRIDRRSPDDCQIADAQRRVDRPNEPIFPWRPGLPGSVTLRES